MFELLVFVMHYLRQLFGRIVSPHAELIPVPVARRQGGECRYAGWICLEAKSARYGWRSSDTLKKPTTGASPPGSVSPGCPPDQLSRT